jgi:HEAT repeat protein
MIPKAVLHMTLLLFCWLAAAAQEVPSVSFAFAPMDAQETSAAAREEERYDEGTELLEEGRFAQAVEAFDAVIAMKGQRADAALYRKAEALSKMGRRNEALAAINTLRRSYPRSNWLKEAAALELEINSTRGPVNPDAQADEELKLMAIQSLMNSDEARAIPMLKKILESPSNSARVKEKALFVLAQSDSQEAKQLVGAVARGQTHPPLQVKAIEYLAVHGGSANTQMLEQIYRSSTDRRAKRAVLQAFIISGSEQSTLAVIREERDPELRGQAIHNLGAMGATAELRQLFQSSTSVEDKEKVIEALGITGEVAVLSEIARTPGNNRVRRRALHGLGISGGSEARQALLAVYSSDKDPEVRKAVVEALFIQDAARELVQLARKETDPQMRRELVQKLSLMDSKEAQDYMIEILNK